MRVYLSLGSNLGDRLANLEAALKQLGTHERIQRMECSGCYETSPVGSLDQPVFLNMAAEIETDLEPLELLNVAKEIEAGLGRTETYRWGPRVVDIDLILCGPAIVESERLTVPHPEFRRRAFVLQPLAEIAPQAVDPVTKKTVAELAASPEAAGQVRRLHDMIVA